MAQKAICHQDQPPALPTQMTISLFMDHWMCFTFDKAGHLCCNTDFVRGPTQVLTGGFWIRIPWEMHVCSGLNLLTTTTRRCCIYHFQVCLNLVIYRELNANVLALWGILISERLIRHKQDKQDHKICYSKKEVFIWNFITVLLLLGKFMSQNIDVEENEHCHMTWCF